MAERIVIIGGGVSGLVAAWVFQRMGKRSVVLEPGSLGGDFLRGGLKYIHKTNSMVEMFDGLGLAWSDYTVRGGALLRGKVEPWPHCLDSMGEDEASRIQSDHYRKTRRAEPKEFGEKSMNDPSARKGARRAIRCDFHAMVKALAARTRVIPHAVTKINSKEGLVQLTDGNSYWYDKLVVTIPMWITRTIADFWVPEGVAMKLNLAQVSPKRHTYAKWDYVYTPYTPGDCIHRLSPYEDGYTMEFNGELTDIIHRKLFQDLAFLLPDGYLLNRVIPNLKGHLLPLPEKPDWPDNVAPLGRFATWNPRATTDVTLREATKLAARWWGDS